ncbi:MAG: hypothetical protein ACXVHX_31035 [Solirubrobacteraceae bacterium]
MLLIAAPTIWTSATELPATGADARPARALPATVTLIGHDRRIPESFSGLSIEFNELASYEHGGVLFDRVIELLRPADGAPVLLRIGGKSADHAYWKEPASGDPTWVFALGDRWQQRLAALVRRDNLRVMLNLNVAVHSPQMAASFTRAAIEQLPAGSLAGVTVGNEPELYVHQPGLQGERVASTMPSTPTNWTRGYGPSDYRRDYRAYAQVLTQALPQVPIGAPEMTAFRPEWLEPLMYLGTLTPRYLTLHAYGSSTCWPTSSSYYPRVATLLGETATHGLADSVRGAIAIGRTRGQSVRVTELNSVSCGGRRGVSDSFATALWAPDALFEMLHAGVLGVNWHIRPGLLNAPFQLTARGVEARPELYGLAVFAQMLGPGAKLAGVRSTFATGLHLKAWAVRTDTHISVLLLNKGSRPARVALRGLPGRMALVTRLSAPSIGSRAGVTLGGRWIGTDGRWHGRTTATRARAQGGAYQILVPGFSATLVTLARARTRRAAAVADTDSIRGARALNLPFGRTRCRPQQ